MNRFFRHQCKKPWGTSILFSLYHILKKGKICMVRNLSLNSVDRLLHSAKIRIFTVLCLGLKG